MQSKNLSALFFCSVYVTAYFKILRLAALAQDDMGGDSNSVQDDMGGDSGHEKILRLAALAQDDIEGQKRTRKDPSARCARSG